MMVGMMMMERTGQRNRKFGISHLLIPEAACVKLYLHKIVPYHQFYSYVQTSCTHNKHYNHSLIKVKMNSQMEFSCPSPCADPITHNFQGPARRTGPV